MPTAVVIRSLLNARAKLRTARLPDAGKLTHGERIRAAALAKECEGLAREIGEAYQTAANRAG